MKAQAGGVWFTLEQMAFWSSEKHPEDYSISTVSSSKKALNIVGDSFGIELLKYRYHNGCVGLIESIQWALTIEI